MPAASCPVGEVPSRGASNIGPTIWVQLAARAGSHGVELYRLNGMRLFAAVRCATCCSNCWLGLGFAPSAGELNGAAAVVGWLDGYASPRFVGKYALSSGGGANLMDYTMQTLEDASVLHRATAYNGIQGLEIAFTATLGIDGFPNTPPAPHLVAATGPTGTVHMGTDTSGWITADCLMRIRAMPPPPPPRLPPRFHTLPRPSRRRRPRLRRGRRGSNPPTPSLCTWPRASSH